ncbi:MAG: aminotransferase class V-fold PLP-dependent enzyme [Theionarchaea archaeon]|nr:aminotransferase class V-fold PLP-dependent enzyme [Theionarchaea archaeon]
MNLKINEVRTEFEPAVSNWVYLNAAACGLTPRCAKQASDMWWNDKFTDGSVHFHDWEMQADQTRENFGKLINAKGEEIAYVMNTSQGINIATNGISFKKGDNIIINELEFPSNFYPWLALKEKGVEIRCIQIEHDRIPVENIESLIDENTRVISISSVQFRDGFRADLHRIGNLCEEHDIYFVVDAIQSLGVLEMDVKRDNIDMMATSCYKWLLGPDGIGFFYCNEEIQEEIASTNIGWMSTSDPWNFSTDLDFHPSAKKFEAGTPPWTLIYSVNAIFDHVFDLLDYLIEELQELNVEIKSSLKDKERSGILTFDINGRENLAELYQKNHVRISVRDGIRVAPHMYNNMEDMGKLIQILKEFIT